MSVKVEKTILSIFMFEKNKEDAPHLGAFIPVFMLDL